MRVKYPSVKTGLDFKLQHILYKLYYKVSVYIA